jgi:hypothetical protein
MKMLLVVVDAASARVFCPAVQTGRLPTFQQLAGAGILHQRSASIFPSITPAATTSIVTGHYPARHGITGAAWLEPESGQIAYYGDDFWVIAREGFGPFLRDFLVRLNGDRLKVPTIFEIVERAGRQAASLNYLVFKARTPHEAHIPGLLAMLPGVPTRETLHGPSLLCLGDFVQHGIPRSASRGTRGLLHRFGMDDAATGALLCALMERRQRPDLTVAYFADNDYRSHEVGPHEALPVLEHVDAMLGEAFERAGGLERLLEDTCVLVTSDHAHCEILPDADRAVVRLDTVLDAIPQAVLAEGWRDGDRIAICPNMRAAQIYLREPAPALLCEVVRRLGEEPRVDQIVFRAGAATRDAPGYTVASARGTVTFDRGTGFDQEARDEHGQQWSWTGELAAVDGHVSDGTLVYGDYPNAFDRIAGVLGGEHSGDVWVTAVPGCEFELPGGHVHVGGGSHGALHALDSLSPIVFAGAPRGVALPAAMRSIDLAPICLRVLGLEA